MRLKTHQRGIRDSRFGWRVATLVGLSAVLSGMCGLSFAGSPLFPDLRESNARPFWIERSTFVHENHLFAVGIASYAKTREDGRQAAFEAAKRELQGYLRRPVTDMVETRDTYEELNGDSSYTVYRLVMIPLIDLPESTIAEIDRQARKHEAENRSKVEAAKQLWLKEKADAEAQYYDELAATIRAAQQRKQEDAKRERKARDDGFNNEALWKVSEGIKAELEEMTYRFSSHYSALIHEAFELHMNAFELMLNQPDDRPEAFAAEWKKRRGDAFGAKLKSEQAQYGKEQQYIRNQLEDCLTVHTSTPQGVRWVWCVEAAESNYEFVKKVGVAEAEKQDKELSSFWDGLL